MMKKKWSFFLGLILIGILLCGMCVKGEEIKEIKEIKAPIETNESHVVNKDNNEYRKALKEIMNTNPEDAFEPVTQINIEKAAYYKNFNYGEPIVLSGAYGTNVHYFEIMDYWDIQYAYAQIEIELSQLIQNVPASLTFMLNDVPITSYRMDYQNGKAQILYVKIPIQNLKEGFNTFGVTGYVRIYDEEGCIDDFSRANWVSISKNSFIQIGYDTKPYKKQICNYPYPFISTIDETGESTCVAVSDQCEEAELEAALMLRADLGNETDEKDYISMVKCSQLPKDRATVLVSMKKNLSASYNQAVEQALNGKDIKQQALILIMEGQQKQPILLITSENPECLKEAAMLLMDKERVSQEKSERAFVKAGSSEQIKKMRAMNTMQAGRYTLDSLQESGMYFTGPYHKEGHIYLPYSGGYVLADSGKVVLKFRYSENLDFKRSLITVYWDNIPVASKQLSKKYAGGDELSFIMPADVVGTLAKKITIAFDLEVSELFCAPRVDEMPWAYVTEDSTFYLPVGAGTKYTLSQRPYPFELASEFNDLCVVIPKEISDEELDTLGRLITLYGESLMPYGTILVKYSDELKTAEDKAHNLIVIGNYTDNKLIQELNENLHFQYKKDGSAFKSNEMLILSEEYASDLSALQLFTSPYNEERAVLVASAIDDQTLHNLNAFMKVSKNVWKFEKDTILIDSDMQIKTFEMTKDKAEKKVPMLKTLMERNEEATIFTLVSVAVMLLFLLAAILILLRVYWRKKK